MRNLIFTSMACLGALLMTGCTQERQRSAQDGVLSTSLTGWIKPDIATIIETPWRDVAQSEAFEADAYWTFEVYLNSDGRVAEAEWASQQSEAELSDQEKQQLKTARHLIAGIVFTPRYADGMLPTEPFYFAIRALPTDYSGPDDRSFPADPDLAGLIIRMKRTQCFGDCPVYDLEIRGDGTVIYRGHSGVAVEGEQRGKISQRQLKQLLHLFRRADYFNLDGRYEACLRHFPSTITSLSIGDQKKYVVDYAGLLVEESCVEENMPKIVRRIEESIDDWSGAKKWVYGE